MVVLKLLEVEYRGQWERSRSGEGLYSRDV